jgi:hypothetical protein
VNVTAAKFEPDVSLRKPQAIAVGYRTASRRRAASTFAAESGYAVA